MAVNIRHNHDRKVQRKHCKSDGIQLPVRLLIKLYRFRARRANAKFNRIFKTIVHE